MLFLVIALGVTGSRLTLLTGKQLVDLRLEPADLRLGLSVPGAKTVGRDCKGLRKQYDLAILWL